ncbi:MAG: hypothetical protein ACXWXT_01160 [Candidatus Binatia bacterium]
MNGKPAFKLAMQGKNSRWYLYVTHLWHRGWSVRDVTDPAAPQYCAYVPGPENTWTIKIQVTEDKVKRAGLKPALQVQYFFAFFVPSHPEHCRRVRLVIR